MQKSGDELLKKLLATFRIEARERVEALSSGLIALEGAPAGEKQAEALETVFREAHSLKGAARAVNLGELEGVCQSLETVFSGLKRKERPLSAPLFDMLHQAVDALAEYLRSIGTEPPTGHAARMEELTRHLESVAQGVLLSAPKEKKPIVEEGAPRPKSEAYPPAVVETPMSAETVRIPTAKLDSLLLQAEELLSAKLAASQRVAELHGISTTLAAWRKEVARIHPEVRALQHGLEESGGRNGQGRRNPPVSKLAEFLEHHSTSLASFESNIAAATKAAEVDSRSLGGMVANLLEDIKRALMLPFSSLLEIFPRFVRNLSREQGKEVDWIVQGGEIEMDRRILEEMKGPLIHLIRNCIDHGIEEPEERRRKKKSPRGTVTVAIAQRNGSKVEILVSDDGAGIDLAKVRAAAVKLSLLAPQEAAKLSDEQVLSFIFQSGVSTSPIITDISGRGLGLAIVQEKVEKLGGFVSLETVPHVGTRFRIVLPLTVATFRGILVRVAEHTFVLPTTNLEWVLRVSREEIKTVENRETIQFQGRAVSLVRLDNALDLSPKTPAGNPADKLPLVILRAAEKCMAFLVDEILNEQEILVKSLGKQLSRVRNIAGAAVLGTGKVVPILNIPDLMKSAARVVPAAKIVAVPAGAPAKRKSLLVVEDSITARMLLKNILESAGYNVTTAIDGVDAFTLLKSEECDLVVSDVDMPRMNGFDLTAKIRADTKLSELPVVLVTALESREDRERGIDVGANAYIVKSSFDQSNLLDVILRLI